MAVGFWQLGLGIYLLTFSLGLSYNAADGKVIELREDSWKQILEGEWMIKFFAPWCPACRHVASTWSAFALKGKQLGVNVAEVDVTAQSALSGRFMVSSLPTIYHVKDGYFRKYTGSRSLDEFVTFVEEQKWHDIEPISSWTAPGSYIMGGLGLMFKFSLSLKDIHDQLTTTYGLPVWGSFAIFGVVTILAGLLLGVVAVYVTDYFSDRRQPQAMPVQSKMSDDEDSKKVPEENAEPVEEKTEESSVRKRKNQATAD